MYFCRRGGIHSRVFRALCVSSHAYKTTREKGYKQKRTAGTAKRPILTASSALYN